MRRTSGAGAGGERQLYDGVTLQDKGPQEDQVNSIIYIIGLIVVVAAVLSFFGLR